MSDYLAPILLVGTGRMAKEYAKVLQAMNIPFVVIGRSEQSCKKFKEMTGIQAISGGVEKFLIQNKGFTYAIVAVSVNQLASVTILLLKHGVRHILVEKPGGLLNELKNICDQTKKYNGKVFIAYNRRFYSSVRKAKELINQDGGLTSLTFFFTERSYLIEKANQPEEVKEQWLLANSSHVIDLAFYLGGKPTLLQSFARGSLSWHPKASVFVGAGMTEENILFSYHADWASSGNWGVHLYTKNYRLILEPLEQLKIQEKGATEIKTIPLDDEFDQKFKPGLYLQVQSFLTSSYKDLKDVFQHEEEVRSIYQPIVNGTSFGRENHCMEK